MTSSNHRRKPRICITAPVIYPIFNNKVVAPFGGYEVRLALIARELAKRGNFDIYIVVGDFGQPHREVIEGINFISWQNRLLWSVENQVGNPSLISATDFYPPIQPTSVNTSFQFTFKNFRYKLSRIKQKVVSYKNKFGHFWVILIRINRILNHLFNISRRVINSIRKVIDSIRKVINLIRRVINFSIKKVIYFSIRIFEFLYLKAPFGKPRGIIGNYIITNSMISIYDEPNADIYLVPTNSEFSAEVAFYCKKTGKKYVFLSTSDLDYYPEYKMKKGKDIYGVPFWMKRYSIESANAHIVQTTRQYNLLKNGYQISSIIIRNPIDLRIIYPRKRSPKTILWVGRSSEQVKQPSIILKLAKELPQYSFIIIMTKGVPATHEKCLKEANQLTNVTLIEKVAYNEIERFFADARIHVNTSIFEGFPNTFLQAAKYGVPTVSLKVDPAKMLSKHNCGLVCGDNFEDLKKGVKLLMEDQLFYEQTSQASLVYIRKYHDKDVIIPQYEKAFNKIMAVNK